MSLRRLVTCAVVGLALSSSAMAQGAGGGARGGAGSPSNDAVAAAIESYTKAVEGVPLNGENFEKYRKAANDAVASLEVEKLTIDEIERLQEKMLVARAFTETQKRVDDRLGVLAKASDADGARAALLRTTTNSMVVQDEAQWKLKSREDADRLVTALKHPGLAKAFEAGKGKNLFANGSISPDLADQAYAETVLGLLALPIPRDVTPRLWSAYTPLVDEKATVTPEMRERIRKACVDKVNAALTASGASGSDADVKLNKSLQTSLKSFEGAFAKGQLVGYDAPEINFLWTDVAGAAAGSSDMKLSDLKGKVVVLDFWAVWCGPCVGSFPQVRELQARYKDYPVVILGVTDLAGTPMPEGYKRGDTLDPAKQATALAAYAKEKDITWALAIGSTDVFNPEYGIRGIPHVAIIDPSGKLRYRAMHPAVDPEKKHERIDGLLKEFKLPSPSN